MVLVLLGPAISCTSPFFNNHRECEIMGTDCKQLQQVSNMSNNIQKKVKWNAARREHFYLVFEFKCFLDIDELLSAAHFSHPLVAFFHNLKIEEAGNKNWWTTCVCVCVIQKVAKLDNLSLYTLIINYRQYITFNKSNIAHWTFTSTPSEL